jgi:hypothetical protein
MKTHGLKLNATKIGDTIEIYDDYSRDVVERKIKARMLRTGEARVDGDIKQWYEDREELDSNHRNIWSKGGMKAKHGRYLIVVNTVENTRKEERIRTVYKDPFV